MILIVPDHKDGKLRKSAYELVRAAQDISVLGEVAGLVIGKDVGVVAVVAALGGTIVLFWALNKLVEALTPAWEHRLKPYVFVGPAIFVVAVIILFPAIRTIYLSFFDARSVNFVGFDNYVVLAVDPTLRSAIINNLLWIIVVPSVSVAVGLLVAVLSDRLKPTTEKITKYSVLRTLSMKSLRSSPSEASRFW
jgi:alpha-glucoside transport system permease protein